MRLQTLVLLAIAVAGSSATGQESGRISAREAARHVGQLATVCGTVITFRCNGPDYTTFLDLDTPYVRPTFSVAIKRADRARFGTRLEDRYRSHEVCVTGTVEKDAAEPRIVATEPGQLAFANPRDQPPPVEGPRRGCDEGVELPRLIRDVKPHYTADAMRAKLQGKVLMQGVVETTGKVRDAEVLYSLDRVDGLDDEALKAFQQWQFQAGTYQGQPAAVAVTVEMSFSLRN
jgi:TonB family protein